MRDRQYRESFLPTPRESVFATCLPLFVFKLEPLCSDMGSPLLDGNTWGVRALLAFSVCIMAHYGTQRNVSIAKLRIRRLVVRILSGAPHSMAVSCPNA